MKTIRRSTGRSGVPGSPKILAFLGFLAAATLLGGCDEILVDDQMVELDATGLVRGTVFVDRNGNLQNDEADGPLAGVEVRIVQPLGDSEVASITTDEAGTFVLEAVPVGTYRADVDPLTLPDSLGIVSGVDETFVVTAGGTNTVRLLASLGTYELAEVLELEPGIRVFTSGIALNPRDPDGDGAVHLRDEDVYLRTTDVENVLVAVGDSLRVSGRTALEAGLPVLDDVDVFFLQEGGVSPVPLDRTTVRASNADGGDLNAALVRIRDADVLDRRTEDGNVVVTVDDGSGPVDLVLRSYLDFDTGAFVPGSARVEEGTGLLVARLEPSTGRVRWRIFPRFVGDVQLTP